QLSLLYFMLTKKNKKPKTDGNEYSALLRLAKKELKNKNYLAAVCFLTSIIDYCSYYKNDQMTIEAKFCNNSQFKEKARDHLIIFYSHEISIEKDTSKANKLYLENLTKINENSKPYFNSN
ncbi:10940_t:CDS:2, partial [Dentiscutata heterogama]